MRRALACLVLVIALAPACKSNEDNTKIVVAVWSDLAIPTELDSVRIDVAGPTGNSSDIFALAAGSESGKTKLPAVLELVPLGAKNATFTVKATGLHGSVEIVAQTARVSFVAGQSLLLKLFLGGNCRTVTCPAEYTCAGGACNQPIAVPNLPPYDPSKPLSSPDASLGIDSGWTVDSSQSLDSIGAVDGGSALDMNGGGALDSRDIGDLAWGAEVERGTDVPISMGGAGGSPGAGGTGGAVGRSGGLDASLSDAGDVAMTGTGGRGGSGGTGGPGGTGAPDASLSDAGVPDAPGSGGVPATGGGSGTGGAVGTGGATATGGATGTPANLVSSVSSLPAYGSVAVGQSSIEASFTITNNGQQMSGQIRLVSSSTDFVIQSGLPGDCVSDSTALAGNTSCLVRVNFSPKQSGARSGTIDFAATPGNGGGVAVSGTGSAASLTSGSTTSLAFASVAVGLSSTLRSFTISNAGDAPTSAIAISATSSEFSIQNGLTGDCVSGTTSLAAGASCTVRVFFTPAATGSRTGAITFSATSGGNRSVEINGTGVQGSLAVLAGVASGSGSANGTGPTARFEGPIAVAADATGNVYVAEIRSAAIRKITPAGVVTIFAGTMGSTGSADGTGAAAQFWGPSGLAADVSGNLYVADSSNSTIRKITPAGVVTTLAGTAGSRGSADGTGPSAQFNYPHGLAVDVAGNVYVADTSNFTIRKLTPAGAVTTLAGLAGSSANKDGTGASARFTQPDGVAVDGAGNVYVSDSNDSSIRKITPAGVVSTIAGPTTPISNPYGIALDGAGNVYYASNCAIWKMAPAGTVATFAGSSCGSADGAGAAAQFDFPHGVALDAAGNVYVPDYHNNTIRKVTPAAVVTTLAGSTGLKGNSPAGARFELPHGVAVDAPGNLYVADTYDSVIRKITPTGTFTTLAGHENSPGNEDGTGTLAQFNYPQGVAADGIGNVYVADTQNHTIRKITPMGVVSTFAGSPGSSGTADGTGTAARFNQPLGVGVDAVGNVYVADWNNSAIRKITPAQVVTTIAGFELPMGVAVDGGGTVYVADTWHQTIKRIDPAGLVTTLAGSLNAAGGVDGTGADARFNFPKGVAVDGAGNVYVADTDNNSIRRITPAGVVSTIVGVLGLPVSGIVPGPLPALLAQPQGLVVDPSTGVLYITVDSAVMVAH